jgi:hypothetical protein
MKINLLHARMCNLSLQSSRTFRSQNGILIKNHRKALNQKLLIITYGPSFSRFDQFAALSLRNFACSLLPQLFLLKNNFTISRGNFFRTQTRRNQLIQLCFQ